MFRFWLSKFRFCRKSDWSTETEKRSHCIQLLWMIFAQTSSIQKSQKFTTHCYMSFQLVKCLKIGLESHGFVQKHSFCVVVIYCHMDWWKNIHFSWLLFVVKNFIHNVVACKWLGVGYMFWGASSESHVSCYKIPKNTGFVDWCQRFYSYLFLYFKIWKPQELWIDATICVDFSLCT